MNRRDSQWSKNDMIRTKTTESFDSSLFKSRAIKQKLYFENMLVCFTETHHQSVVSSSSCHLALSALT